MTTLAKTPVQAKPEKREVKVFPSVVTNIDEALGVVEAVVNVFGIVDLGYDVIHNGAYTKTLNERGNKVRVKVLDSHNTDSVMRVVGKPLEIREIGRDELARVAPDVIAEHPEATGGLLTKTQYLIDTPEGMGVFKRIAANAVNEYSIALDVLQSDVTTETIEGKPRSVRHIRALRLWEFSPVVFGMNQATVTTDVKSETAQPDSAPEDKATDTPSDQKQRTLGSTLEANMRMSANFCIVDCLSEGTITPETVDALNQAVSLGMSAMRMAMPAEAADKPLVSYWGADEAGEHKAGRMISAANRGKIQSAIDALQALLDADMPASDEAETQDDKSLTGSGAAVDETPTTPSIPEPNGESSPEQVALAADQIDRELTELQLLMAVA